MKKAIIYGLGQRYQMFNSWIRKEVVNEYEIVAVSDRQKPTIAINDLFIEPQKIGAIDFDTIIITSDRYFTEISGEIQNKYGIADNKIISMECLIEDIYNRKLHADLFAGKYGVEVGGPSSVFAKNIYNVCKSCDGVNYNENTVWWEKDNDRYFYEDKELGKVIISDATDLSAIKDEKYDFCISSNNLEHIANPIKALKEQYRIVKVGGILLVIVPMKETCFDHNREYTSFEHLMEDYSNDISERDLTHLDEILQKHDISMDLGCVGGMDEFKSRALKNYENRCLHHHVFSKEVLISIFEYLNITIIDCGETDWIYYIIGSK